MTSVENFRGALRQKVKFLSLYKNRITELPAESLSYFPVLVELILADNQISVINPTALIVLQELRFCDLSSNNITSIGDEVDGFNAYGNRFLGTFLYYSTKLEYLYLYNNEIRTLYKSFWVDRRERCRAQLTIDFTNNQISEIRRDLFQDDECIGALIFRQNPIAYLIGSSENLAQSFCPRNYLNKLVLSDQTTQISLCKVYGNF